MRVFSGKYFYSNCLIEVLKLKLLYGKRIKICKAKGKCHFYCRSTKSDVRLHFWAYDENSIKTVFDYMWHKGKLKASW